MTKSSNCTDHGQRGCSRAGYGSVVFRGKPQKAHRAAFMREHQCSLLPGVVVRHTCDNPRCVNPDHLLLGDVYDNNRDRDVRGRTAKGERASKAKLTEEQVLEIRARYSKGDCTQRSIALDYDVDHKSICEIVNRKTWRHV